MNPKQFLVDYVVAHGDIVTFFCRQAGTDERSAVHVDHRSWNDIWRELRQDPRHRTFAAAGVSLALEVSAFGPPAPEAVQ